MGLWGYRYIKLNFKVFLRGCSVAMVTLGLYVKEIIVHFSRKPANAKM